MKRKNNKKSPDIPEMNVGGFFKDLGKWFVNTNAQKVSMFTGDVPRLEYETGTFKTIGKPLEQGVKQFGKMADAVGTQALNTVMPGSGDALGGLNKSMAGPEVVDAPQIKGEEVTLNKNPYGMPTFKLGGMLKKYNAPTHENGGQMIDANGNPINTSSNAVAEIEKKETSFKDFVFSDNLEAKKDKTYAQESKRIARKYANKVDKLSKNTMEFQMKNLMSANQQHKELVETEEQMKNGGVMKYGNGGWPVDDPIDLSKQPSPGWLGRDFLRGDLYNQLHNDRYYDNLKKNPYISDPTTRDNIQIARTRDIMSNYDSPEAILYGENNPDVSSQEFPNYYIPDGTKEVISEKEVEKRKSSMTSLEKKKGYVTNKQNQETFPQLGNLSNLAKLSNDNNQTFPQEDYRITDKDVDMTKVSTNKPKNKFQLSPEMIGTALKGAGIVKSGFDALQPAEKEKLQLNPNANRVENLMSNRNVNFAALQNENLYNRNAALENAKNTRSANVNRALDSNIYTQAARNAMRSKLDEQQANNQLRGEEAQTLNNLGMQESNERIRQQNIQSMNDATKRGFERSFFEDLGKVGDSVIDKGIYDQTMKNMQANYANEFQQNVQLLRDKAVNFTFMEDADKIMKKLANQETLTAKEWETIMRLNTEAKKVKQ